MSSQESKINTMKIINSDIESTTVEVDIDAVPPPPPEPEKKK